MTKSNNNTRANDVNDGSFDGTQSTPSDVSIGRNIDVSPYIVRDEIILDAIAKINKEGDDRLFNPELVFRNGDEKVGIASRGYTVLWTVIDIIFSIDMVEDKIFIIIGKSFLPFALAVDTYSVRMYLRMMMIYKIGEAALRRRRLNTKGNEPTSEELSLFGRTALTQMPVSMRGVYTGNYYPDSMWVKAIADHCVNPEKYGPEHISAYVLGACGTASLKIALEEAVDECMMMTEKMSEIQWELPTPLPNEAFVITTVDAEPDEVEEEKGSNEDEKKDDEEQGIFSSRRKKASA